MMLCSRACVLLSPRALVLSCSHEFMLSGSPTVMPSCYRASKLSYRKESGNALLFCYLASRLVFSDSLPSSLFIPSESIRSLSNSLPVLARTGFENRAPVEATRSFLKIKVSSYISFVRMFRTGALGTSFWLGCLARGRLGASFWVGCFVRGRWGLSF